MTRIKSKKPKIGPSKKRNANDTNKIKRNCIFPNKLIAKELKYYLATNIQNPTK